MFTRLETAQQKWGGRLTAIDSWLDDRQGLIVSYCQLAALPPFDKKSQQSLPASSDVQTFCQKLMDYLSAGHFEMYERIVSECAVNGHDSRKLADALTPKISASTDVALEFNDKYAEVADEQWTVAFDQDLSELGQKLVERFDYEDQLIQTLHNKHSDAVSV